MKRPPEQYSTRCIISHRPPYRSGEPQFYRCCACGSVLVRLPRREGQRLPAPSVVCCENPLAPLSAGEDPAVLEAHAMDYVVFGGYEHNAVQIRVASAAHPMTAEHHIEWIYFYTYQGGQLKYLPLFGSAKATFALAEEDAYAYCDRPVCNMGRGVCQYRCKRGNAAFAYCNVHGLHVIRFC